MELLDLLTKFITTPAACTEGELQRLATEVNLAHPDALALIEAGNSYPRKWSGLLSDIQRATWERQNFAALSKEPWATPEALEAQAAPSELADLPQSEIAKLVFGV